MADTSVPKPNRIDGPTRAILIVGWLLWSHALFAQSELSQAVAVAQDAWLGHRVADLRMLSANLSNVNTIPCARAAYPRTDHLSSMEARAYTHP